MKHVEVSDLVSAVPIKMVRREKLLRWADLVRKTHNGLHLYHNLEYMTRGQLAETRPIGSGSAFDVAVRDPEFAAQGLRYESSIQEVLDFFELTQPQAHAFSCDCGGDISNEEQARRIERLAR
jgi:hypothetical protein